MKAFILFLIAVLLGVILLPIGFVYTFMDLAIELNYKGFKAKITDYLYSISLMIDIFSNTVLRELFNDTLIKKSGYKFGTNRDETISSVLGKNLLMGRLTKIGRILVNILDSLEEDHCINAIKG